jgi:hypothetical protein
MNAKKETFLKAFVNMVSDMAQGLLELMDTDLIDPTMPAPVMAQAMSQKAYQLKPTYNYNYNNKNQK